MSQKLKETARDRWKDPKMVNAIPEIIKLIAQEEPWDHLLEGMEGYYPGMKDLSGAPLKGMSFANLKLEGIFFEFADCQEADFSNSFCINCQFTGIDMTDANLQKAYFDNCQFGKGMLVGANFKEADLHFSIFMGADVTKANFTNANLKGANFRGAKIDNAVFENANVEYARFDSLRKHK